MVISLGILTQHFQVQTHIYIYTHARVHLKDQGPYDWSSDCDHVFHIMCLSLSNFAKLDMT